MQKLVTQKLTHSCAVLIVSYPGYLLPAHDEQQSKIVSDASRNIGVEDNDKGSEQEEVQQVC